jgi:UDP-glucuronate decarboxylase
MINYISGKKNILVTGGAEFLGSHLCDKLIKEANVLCIDDFTSSDQKNIDHFLRLPNFEFIKHDISQPIDLEQTKEGKKFKIEFQGIQEIYHLACPTSAKNFDKLRIKTLYSNSQGIINILEIAKKYKAKFLFTSSSVVYGPRRKEKPYFKEDYQGSVNFVSARACYDEGKRFSETACVTYREMYGLDTKTIRVFRTYGPRMLLFDGQMVPDFVLQALNNKPLIIYGDEFFSSSFCYVSDIIDGLIKMMASEEAGPINLGHPDEILIQDIAKKIIAKTNSESEIEFREPLLFMTPLGLPEITLAKKKLGWLPLVGLNEGLDKTIRDIEANRLLLQPMVSKYDEE